jgi:hypothetical protein
MVVLHGNSSACWWWCMVVLHGTMQQQTLCTDTAPTDTHHLVSNVQRRQKATTGTIAARHGVCTHALLGWCLSARGATLRALLRALGLGLQVPWCHSKADSRWLVVGATWRTQLVLLCSFQPLSLATLPCRPRPKRTHARNAVLLPPTHLRHLAPWAALGHKHRSAPPNFHTPLRLAAGACSPPPNPPPPGSGKHPSRSRAPPHPATLSTTTARPPSRDAGAAHACRAWGHVAPHGWRPRC